MNSDTYKAQYSEIQNQISDNLSEIEQLNRRKETLYNDYVNSFSDIKTGDFCQLDIYDGNTYRCLGFRKPVFLDHEADSKHIICILGKIRINGLTSKRRRFVKLSELVKCK